MTPQEHMVHNFEYQQRVKTPGQYANRIKPHHFKNLMSFNQNVFSGPVEINADHVMSKGDHGGKNKA